MMSDRITFNIDEEKHNKVKVKAAKEKKTMTEIIHELLDKWLKKGE